LFPGKNKKIQASVQVPFLFQLSCIMFSKQRIHLFIVFGLFAVYLLNGFFAIPRNSVTYDEMDHWSYGKRILKLQPGKVYIFDDASAMPVTGLNALPRAVEQVLNPELSKTDGGFSDIMHGRYVTVLVCLLTGFFIYRWARELFGDGGGLFSLFLFVFCPNLGAHETLLTTDAYAALFTVSTAYYFWKFIRESGWNFFLLFCISLGLAQIAKYSLVHLFVIFALASWITLIRRKTIFTGWKKNLIRLIVLTGTVLLVINAAYFFSKSGTSLINLELHSQVLGKLENTFLGRIPLPLPGPYVEGMDMTMHMTELGAGDKNVSGVNYLAGEKRAGKGFWQYYFVVFFFKTPISVLLIMAAAMIFLFYREKRGGHPASMLFLLGIIFYFLIVLGVTSTVQIGLRHALMIYPVLYVLAGFIFTNPVNTLNRKLATAGLIAYSVFSFYYYYPNILSYTNELVMDKKNAYKIMADSNLDFGQGEFAVEEFLRKNTSVQRAGNTPAAGKFVIGINDYLDLNRTGKFNWLKTFKPAGHVNFCYLYFDIKAAELNQ
jgi:hypothetical protein